MRGVCQHPVIPWRRQRVRPEVAGPMTGSAASSESIVTCAAIMDSGFLALLRPE